MPSEIENVMSEEEYERTYGHSRNIPVSLRTDETFDEMPFILTVGYITPKGTQGNAHRGVELDREIMPYIRRAIEEYKKNRPAEFVNQRFRRQ